jgi:osmotically-inducible protein OsmY
VLITGQVPTEALKKQIGKLVSGVDNVRVVNNELTISAPSSLTTRASDSMLTSNVKLRFVNDKKLIADRIKVITENGTVFLMGIVSRTEGDIATDLARTTSGVQRVVKMFEYVD